MALSAEQLAQEPERTMYDYSFAWEGEQETVTDMGDARIHALAVPWFGVHGMVVRMKFTPETVDERLDAVIEEAERGERRMLFIVGPSSEPTDLSERFAARGLKASVLWDGMILEDLSTDVEGKPEVVTEPLSVKTAEGFARLKSFGAADPAIFTERLAAAHRYLEDPDHQSEIVVARLGDRVAGYVVMRVEPNGVAYFRDAFTDPEMRQHGVYVSLVAHRLRLAREMGASAGAVQANQQTSSPILQKRGWRPVSRIEGWARPSEEGGEGW